jgi:alpha-L-rhamnosidase
MTEEPNWFQQAYEIQVARMGDDLDGHADRIWDSGRVESEQSQRVRCPVELGFGTAYQWRVRVWWGQTGPSDWSPVSSFETEPSPDSWRARWVFPGYEEAGSTMQPTPYFRRAFTASVPDKARLRLTAKGLVEAWINGQKVSEDLFVPGYTSYRNRILYRTYDVASLLRDGENCLGLIVGDGWYRGNALFGNCANLFGTRTAGSSGA